MERTQEEWRQRKARPLESRPSNPRGRRVNEPAPFMEGIVSDEQEGQGPVREESSTGRHVVEGPVSRV